MTAETHEVDPREIIANTKTGDDSTDWTIEFALLLSLHGARLAQLLADMSDHGQREPIWIDQTDQRLVDGHHRVLCALLLGRDVSVKYEALS